MNLLYAIRNGRSSCSVENKFENYIDDENK